MAVTLGHKRVFSCFSLTRTLRWNEHWHPVQRRWTGLTREWLASILDVISILFNCL